MANLLLNKQRIGIKIDWNSFFEQFKTAYLDYVRKIWAVFYDNLHNDDDDDLTMVKEKFDKAYAKVEAQLNFLYKEPEAAILNYLVKFLASSFVPQNDLLGGYAKLTLLSNNNSSINSNNNNTTKLTGERKIL